MSVLKNTLLAAAVVVILPMAAIAQSGSTQSTGAKASDLRYCQALVGAYEQYLGMSQKRGAQPQSLETKAGVEKCKAGDTSGIPAIEKALKNAKFDLPSRT